MIYTCIPYAPKEHDKDLAWAYNRFMEILPNDDDWGCFIDHDSMFTTLDWFHQLDEIIKNHPEYSCFTAVTNREYASWQIPEGVDVNNHDVVYHRRFGAQLSEQNYGKVVDVTNCSESLSSTQPQASPMEISPFGGIMILYKKSVWKNIPFRKYYKEKSIFGTDNLIHIDLKKAGHKVGLTTGVYLYHWRRADKESGFIPNKSPGQKDGLVPSKLPEKNFLDVPSGLKWIKDAKFEKKEEVGMDVKAAKYKISQCKGENFIIIGVPLPYTRNIDLLTCLWVEYQKRKDNMMALYEPTRFASYGRNNVIYKTLQYLQDATHVFFVDNDVLPPVDAIERLLAHDKDVIVGVTPIYKGQPVWSVMKYDPDETVDNVFKPIPYVELPDKLFRAQHFGATTVLIKTHVLEKMQFPWYQDIFAPGALILGQDLFFTAAARRMGFELWCDPTVQCEHIRQTEMKSVFNKCCLPENDKSEPSKPSKIQLEILEICRGIDEDGDDQYDVKSKLKELVDGKVDN